MLSVLVPLRLMDYSETTANATVAVLHLYLVFLLYARPVEHQINTHICHII